jgi:hypothetical protein
MRGGGCGLLPANVHTWAWRNKCNTFRVLGRKFSAYRKTSYRRANALCLRLCVSKLVTFLRIGHVSLFRRAGVVTPRGGSAFRRSNRALTRTFIISRWHCSLRERTPFWIAMIQSDQADATFNKQNPSTLRPYLTTLKKGYA